jgi:hypothetical protein
MRAQGALTLLAEGRSEILAHDVIQIDKAVGHQQAKESEI